MFPKRQVSVFPQLMTDCVLIEKDPGLHPGGFRPDFDSRFELIKCYGSRSESGIDNVPFIKQELTKMFKKSL